MAITLPLDILTAEEKLRLMEFLWDSLCAAPGNVASPGWHADILQAREAALVAGEEQFQDWDAAKEGIRRELP